METEVFYYEWTYWESQTDAQITNRSDVKVTREFVDERGKDNLHARYRILEESKEIVESCAVVEGIYDQSRRRPCF